MKSVKSIVLVSILAIQFSTNAQESVEQKRLAFGFNFGLNYSYLYNGKPNDQLSIQNNAGFRLGIISSYQLNKKLSILPKAELSFNNGMITENLTNYTVYKNSIDLMVHFKYSIGEGKNRLYFFTGPDYRMPLKSESDNIATNGTIALDFGFGIDLKLKNFMISPEFRMSSGFNDPRTNPTGNKLHFNNFALIINFSSL